MVLSYRFCKGSSSLNGRAEHPVNAELAFQPIRKAFVAGTHHHTDIGDRCAEFQGDLKVQCIICGS